MAPLSPPSDVVDAAKADSELDSNVYGLSISALVPNVPSLLLGKNGTRVVLSLVVVLAGLLHVTLVAPNHALTQLRFPSFLVP